VFRLIFFSAGNRSFSLYIFEYNERGAIVDLACRPSHRGDTPAPASRPSYASAPYLRVGEDATRRRDISANRHVDERRLGKVSREFDRLGDAIVEGDGEARAVDSRSTAPGAERRAIGARISDELAEPTTLRSAALRYCIALGDPPLAKRRATSPRSSQRVVAKPQLKSRFPAVWRKLTANATFPQNSSSRGTLVAEVRHS
jgi:hypothetical protein